MRSLRPCWNVSNALTLVAVVAVVGSLARPFFHLQPMEDWSGTCNTCPMFNLRILTERGESTECGPLITPGPLTSCPHQVMQQAAVTAGTSAVEAGDRGRPFSAARALGEACEQCQLSGGGSELVESLLP